MLRIYSPTFIVATIAIVLGGIFLFFRTRNSVAKKIIGTEGNLSAVLAAIRNTQLVSEYEMDGALITANDLFCNAMGYRLDEIQGKHHSMFLSTEDANNPDYSEFWNALNRGEFQTGEFRRIGKGGKEVWVQATYTPIPGPNGTPVKLVEFATDISDQKLRTLDYEGQVGAIRNTQLVSEFKMDGTLITANDLFCDAMDFRLDEIQGEHHSMFLSIEDANNPDYTAFWDALNRGEFQAGEFRRIGKGGNEIWIQASYTPILDPSGTPTKVVKYSTNISETIAYQNQIKDNENRTRAILNTVIDGIITIDSKGTVETFNPAAERLFDYTSNEVIGKNIKCLMPEPYHSEHDGYLGNYLNTGQAKVIGIGREVIGRRKDGSTFPMELAVGEMELGGIQMFTGIVRDITDRKQAEMVKSEFVSTVSHELRTPLTSIKGALGLVQSGAIVELPDKLKSMIGIAYSNCDRLVRLINDILDIEKIEAGKTNFHLEPMDLGPLLEQAIEANKGYGEEHGVSFVLSSDRPEANVKGDHDRLMQALSNLMSNAAKFSPKGDSIEISLSKRDSGFRVSVTDRGPGIPEEFRGKIFGKFSQADSSDTRQKSGTGLGLNITRAIIEQHGGTIGFETETGKGTTFFFDMPELQEQQIADDDVASVEDISQYHVLICEDEPDIAKLLEIMLNQDGFTTEICINAAEAENLLGKNAYDAMTLDLGLPDKDGITLLRELREKPETRDMPIIVISAKAIDGAKELNGDAFGVIDWLEKPINQERLSEGLRRAVAFSSSGKTRILHVEDDPDILQVVSTLVDDLAEIIPAKTLSKAKSLLEQQTFDLVILDLMLPDGDGEDLLPLLKKDGHKSTPVIVFSAKNISKQTAESVKTALVKSRTSNESLLATIRSAIEASKSTKN